MTKLFMGQPVVFTYSDADPHIPRMARHDTMAGCIVSRNNDENGSALYLVDFGPVDPRFDMSPGEKGRIQWWCRRDSLTPTYAKKYKITVKRKENRNA